MFVGLFLGSVFCSMDLSVFVPVPYCLNDYSFVIQLEVWDCDVSSFGFLFQDCFGYLGSFRIVCSNPVKNAGVISIGIALNM